MYNPFIQVEIQDGELEQIMEELSQATETIYKCYSKLKVMGVLVIKKEEADSGN